MGAPLTSLPRAYFDEVYRASSDPWGFRTRAYEVRKRQLTMAMLPDPGYRSVFEPGCSVGVLTTLLAERSERLLAMDISAQALEIAAAGLPDHVELRQGTLPDDWPQEQFELVLLSEVGYYLGEDDCRRMAELAARSARDLVAVHWRHPVDDYPLGGDEVHSILEDAAQANNLTALVHHIEEDLRIDVWSADGRSVARRSGLLPGVA
jgi:trans-aconitate methyltransferase